MLAIIIMTSVTSAVLTVLLLGGVVHYLIRPRLEKEMKAQFDEHSENAIAAIEERIENAVKRGVVAGVSALTQKDVIQDTTRSLARTSAEILESRINNFFYGKQHNKDD